MFVVDILTYRPPRDYIDFDNVTTDVKEAVKQILAKHQEGLLLRDGVYYYRDSPDAEYTLLLDEVPDKKQPHSMDELVDYVARVRTITFGGMSNYPATYNILELNDDQIEDYKSEQLRYEAIAAASWLDD